MLLPRVFGIAIDLKKRLELDVQAAFGAFRLLLGSSTAVRHPLAKNEIYLAFSRSVSVFITRLLYTLSVYLF